MRKKSNSLFKQNSQQPHVFRGGEIKVMKKKIAAFVLSAALVLPTSLTAFAATTPSDVVGKPNQSAIEELAALDILKGYEDGTFKPENNITRAELAKVIVAATGSEKAALALQNVKSQFKDVKTNEWYTGYINVAAGKGFLLGDKGTGKFRPSDNIKFEEVTAIIVRALGYQDKNLTGAWPYNVLLKAESLNLFNKTTLAQGTVTTRGVVAQLVSNALGEDLVQWNADAQLYTNTGKLLISRLGTTSEQVLNSAVLDSNGRIVLNNVPKTLAPKFIVTGGKTLSDLLAHNLTVLTDTDGKIRAITDNQVADNVISGKLNAQFNNAGQLEVKIGSAVSKYDTVTSSAYYVNSDATATTDFPIAKDTEVSVFLFDNTAANVQAGVVGKVRAVAFTKVNAADALFDSYIAATSTTKARILTQSNVSATVGDTTSVTINGEAKAVTDLVKNDVLDVVYNKDKVAVKISATRTVVEGKIASKSTQADNTVIYTVDGKNYNSVTGALTGSKELVKDASYKLFLNKDGKIAGAELLSGGTADAKYGIILNVAGNVKGSDAFSSTNDVFKYYSIKENATKNVNLNKATWNDTNGSDGTLVKLGDDVENTTPTAAFNNSQAAIVIWNLKKSDNSINGIDEIRTLTKTTTISEKTDKTLKVTTGSGTTTFDINENTVVLDGTKAFAANAGDRSISVSNLASLSAGNKVTLITEGASTFAKYVIVTEKAAKDAKETKYGLFVNASSNGDDYSVTLNIKGTNETFALTGSEGKKIYNAIAADLTAGNSTYKSGSKTLVVLKDTVDATATAQDHKEASTAYDTLGVVPANKNIATASLSDGTITFVGDTTKYYVNSGTAIYVYDKVSDTLSTDGIFADVTAYAGEANSKYSIAVVGDSNYGDFTLAKAIVLVKK
ncbi:S-layer homology domain-containing protein [Paenibacillus sp. FJAT-27812]|uniref:S-layer homology domain-containing protein n=1 Tax=Paenibacillus sp. FJAT-27812 TaxID=1684143 RepID=UPI0006A769E8|nr:S-layer homology domain-containing protein [Paenibacillus sp. FJAT-27812]